MVLGFPVVKVPSTYLPMNMLNSGVVEGTPYTIEEQVGTLEVVSGQHGNAIYFDGESNAKVTTDGDSCFWDPTKCSEGLTTAMWIKAGNKDSSDMFFYSSGGHRDVGVAFSLQDDEFKVVIRTPESTYKVLSEIQVQRGSWYHVAYTWAEKQNINLYVNGVSSNRDQKLNSQTNDMRSLAFYFGCKNNVFVTPNDKWGEFTIDEFLFIPSKSTADTIQQLFEASRGNVH